VSRLAGSRLGTVAAFHDGQSLTGPKRWHIPTLRLVEHSAPIMSAAVEQHQPIYTGMNPPPHAGTPDAGVDTVSLTSLVASLEVSKDVGAGTIPNNAAGVAQNGEDAAGDEKRTEPANARRNNVRPSMHHPSQEPEARGTRTARSPRHSSGGASQGMAGMWPLSGQMGGVYPPPSQMNVYAMYPLAYGPTASPPGAPPFFNISPQPGAMQSLEHGSPPHLPTMFPAFPSGSFGPGGYMFGSSPPGAVMTETMPGNNHAWGAQQHYLPHQHPPPPPPHGMHYGGTAAPPPPPRRSASSIISGSSSGSLTAVADFSNNSDSITTTSSSGKPPCAFFMKTGTCAYGDKCKFDHPAGRQPPRLNSLGFPMRPNEADCVYFMKKGTCGFGITCKFNHPEVSIPGWPRASPGTSPAASMMPASPMLMYPGMMGQPVMPVMPFPASQPLPNPVPVVQHPMAPAAVPNAVLSGSPNHISARSGWNGTPPPPPPPSAHSPGSHSTASDSTSQVQNQPLPQSTAGHGSPTAHLHEMLGISSPGSSELQPEGSSTETEPKESVNPAQVSVESSEVKHGEVMQKGAVVTPSVPPPVPQPGAVMSAEQMASAPSACASHVPTTHCTTVTAS